MSLVFTVYDSPLWQQPQEGQVPSTIIEFTRDAFKSIAPVLFESTAITLNSGQQIALAAANAGLPMLITMWWYATSIQRNNILIFNFDSGFPVAGYEVNVETVQEIEGKGLHSITKQVIVQDQTVSVFRIFNQSPNIIRGGVRGTRVERVSGLLPTGGGGGGNVTVDNFKDLINLKIQNNNQSNNRPVGSGVQRDVGPNPIP